MSLDEGDIDEAALSHLRSITPSPLDGPSEGHLGPLSKAVRPVQGAGCSE